MFDDEDDQEIPLAVRQLLNHRQDMYNKVKEARRHTNQGTFRYPERLGWYEQMHPDNLGLEYEFVRRFDRNVRHGVGVITKVEWLTPLEEIEYKPEVVNRYGEEVNAPWYKVLSDSLGAAPENPDR